MIFLNSAYEIFELSVWGCWTKLTFLHVCRRSRWPSIISDEDFEKNLFQGELRYWLFGLRNLVNTLRDKRRYRYHLLLSPSRLTVPIGASSSFRFWLGLMWKTESFGASVGLVGGVKKLSTSVWRLHPFRWFKINSSSIFVFSVHQRSEGPSLPSLYSHFHHLHLLHLFSASWHRELPVSLDVE